MHIEIVPASDMEVKDAVAEAGKLKLTPLFFGNGFTSNIALIKAFNDEGKIISMTLVQVSGVTGHVKVQDRSAPVPAAMERKKKPKADEPSRAEPARK
jgi:hypothetical protein